MKIKLAGFHKLGELFDAQGMRGLDFVSMSIGYDGRAYFLF